MSESDGRVSSTLVREPPLARLKRGAFEDRAIEIAFCTEQFKGSFHTQWSLLVCAAVLHGLIAFCAETEELASAAGRKVPLILLMAALRVWLHHYRTKPQARKVMSFVFCSVILATRVFPIIKTMSDGSESCESMESVSVATAASNMYVLALTVLMAQIHLCHINVLYRIRGKARTPLLVSGLSRSSLLSCRRSGRRRGGPLPRAVWTFRPDFSRDRSPCHSCDTYPAQEHRTNVISDLHPRCAPGSARIRLGRSRKVHHLRVGVCRR